MRPLASGGAISRPATRGSRASRISAFDPTSQAGRGVLDRCAGCARIDRIGDAPLFRIDAVHHKIALFPSTFAGVQHVNHQVESIDDLMRSWYWLQEQRIPIVFGPGRHPTSGARFLYFAGPEEMVYEYSTGVRLIAPEEEATYRPRQFPFEPKGFCMWGSKPQIVEFQS